MSEKAVESARDGLLMVISDVSFTRLEMSAVLSCWAGRQAMAGTTGRPVVGQGIREAGRAPVRTIDAIGVYNLGISSMQVINPTEKKKKKRGNFGGRPGLKYSA